MTQEYDQFKHPNARISNSIALWIFCFLLAHYLAVFVHEYAHSIVAFALGHKGNPLSIHFGSLNIFNVLLLNEIDEQVDYAAMFTHDAGPAAALVAFAGPGLGNMLTYFGSTVLLNNQKIKASSAVFMFAYALNVMSVGNFFSYVPIRTFASHGDIGHISQGFRVSPWLPLIFLGLPTLIAVWWLFIRTLPMTMQIVAPDSLQRRKLLVTLSVVIVFGFFGLAGWTGYGPVSHLLSLASALLIPIMMVQCWPRALDAH